ncbi:MAG: hypothetical protein JST49_09260, partial [Bacteroidetes bacterium]|nr:hypothetical protein [Bacteroidota bacterium]
MANDYTYMTISEDMLEVIRTLEDKNWLITFFPITDQGLYNPVSYVHNKFFEDVSYTLIPDRNIFSYIVDSSKDKRATDNTRGAACLILFCQWAEINIEPNMSIYEYIDFDKKKIAKALDEIEIFRTVDNYSEEQILQYALGEIDYIPFSKVVENKNRKEMSDDFHKQNFLDEWDYFYLIALKAVSINKLTMDNAFKRKEFIYWMSNEARMSPVSFIYSIFLFSENRLKGMIKYKEKDTPDKKKLSITNMTWDMFFVNNCLRCCQQKQQNEEYIFASNDKQVKLLLKVLAQILISGNIAP